MKRHIRTPSDHLHLDLSTAIHEKQQYKRRPPKSRKLSVEECDYVQDLPSKVWTPAVVKAQQGTRVYLLELEDGRMVHRHVDHIRQERQMKVQRKEVLRSLTLICKVEKHENHNEQNSL